jgi:ankyrin repeat protein
MLASRYSNDTSSLETVKELIKSGANIDIQDKEGWTALMLASRYSNDTSSLETVKELIKSGANLNLQNNDGFTALMLTETIQELIKSGANLDLQNCERMTALMLASNNNKLEIVKELIKYGANLDLQDFEGYTALIFASSNYLINNNSQEIIKELIKAGANLNISNMVNDSCLSYLVRYSNSFELIKDIISRGASVNNLNMCTDVNSLEYKYSGNSLLHWCAIGINENTSSYEILSYLETLEIDKTVKNQENKTYSDYLIHINRYYISNECHICYQTVQYITILNCECNCGKICLNCSKLINNKCPYCKKQFSEIQMFNFV